VRLFVAINLPADVRHDVVQATESLRAAAPELAWVREPNLHLTLKFLGEQPGEMVERLQEALTTVAARHRELVVELEGIGAFPNFRRARVVWLGIIPEGRLELVHHDLEVAGEQLGFELEGRPFRPHLTLARVKHPLAEPAARALSRAAKAVDVRSEFVVRSIDLMQSELSPAGSRYITLVSAPMRSR
jgi:2'-5' RNA ligase